MGTGGQQKEITSTLTPKTIVIHKMIATSISLDVGQMNKNIQQAGFPDGHPL
jgi:hypothetical protein